MLCFLDKKTGHRWGAFRFIGSTQAISTDFMGHESQINRDYICFSFNHSHFQLNLYNLKSFTIFSSGGRFCEAKAKSKSQPNGTPLRWFSTTTRATSFHVKRCYTWNKARLFLKSFEKWQYFPHGKFPVDLESFQLIWKVSRRPGKFPDYLENATSTNNNGADPRNQ